MNPGKLWQNSLTEAGEVLSRFMNNSENMEKCVQFSDLLIETCKNRGTLFTCGNGGSHCDAMHFAEEMTGRYRSERSPLAALALGEASHITCVANDYGFEHIFSRQLEALGRPGDILIGLSTSGQSRNVINAFGVAREKSIKSVALLGKTGGQLRDLADLAIVVPAQTSDRIQEVHIKLIHTVIEIVERELFPENYKSQKSTDEALDQYTVK